MIIKDNVLKETVGIAKDISEQYELFHITGNNPQKSIEYLIEIVKKNLTNEINILEVDIAYDKSAVYSMCVIKPDKAIDIVIAKDLNYCWKRFAICKEIFHLLIDRPDYRALDIELHTESVLIAFPIDDAIPSTSVQVEFLAEVAAMEFLFPYKSRLVQLSTSAGNVNFPDIAQKYKMPQIFVERYLTDNYINSLKLD